MDRPMKTIPILAGTLVLAFALALALSVTRVTTTYVYRSVHGEEEFALEVPRGWTYQPVQNTTMEYVMGKLPSGAPARIVLRVHRYASPAGRYPDAPLKRVEKEDEIREEWAEDGWRRTVSARLRPSARNEVMALDARIERGDVTFSATTFGPDLQGEDLRLMDRCLRSMRWIGGPSP
jgi:hypothetical protein